MTTKDKKLAKVLELSSVQGRIEELQRSKTWGIQSAYYRKRLSSLEAKEEELKDSLGIGDDEVETESIKFTLRLPEKFLKGKKAEEDYVQYIKRTILVEE